MVRSLSTSHRKYIAAYAILASLILLFIFSGCHKDPQLDNLTDEDYFQVEFSMEASPQASLNPLSTDRTPVHTLTPSVQEDAYLYFWSFHQESRTPDIAIHPGANLSYNGGLIPDNFAAGWAYGQFPAGRSLSITGLTELSIAVPVQAIASLSTIGFDISSSGTGPKAFDVYYVIGESQWTPLRLDNQFSNVTTAHARNSFTFDISEIDFRDGDALTFQIRPKAGSRAQNSHYNPTAGATRIGNIYVQGTALPPEQQTGDQVRIYAFDQQSGELVGSAVHDYQDDMPAISLSLPQGAYRFAFLRHSAAAGLILPAYVGSSEAFYFTKPFANKRGQVYGYEADIYINQDLQEHISLDRYYSQVRFQFTDGHDLSNVARILITRQHEPAFFAPFNTSLINPVLDQSDIEIIPDFRTSKEFSFNQFIGRVDEPVPLAYHITAYDASGHVLRDFEVRAAARHNAQVLFQGQLLGPLPFQATFQIRINDSWDETVEADF